MLDNQWRHGRATPARAGTEVTSSAYQAAKAFLEESERVVAPVAFVTNDVFDAAAVGFEPRGILGILGGLGLELVSNPDAANEWK